MQRKSIINFREEIIERFVCQKSGNCCKSSGYVYASHQEMTRMAKTLNISLHKFRKHFVTNINGWPLISSPEFRNECFLNNDSKCTIYHDRPLACKTYPNWDTIWENELSLQNEMEQCPGLKLAVNSLQQLV